MVVPVVVIVVMEAYQVTYQVTYQVRQVKLVNLMMFDAAVAVVAVDCLLIGE